jgi:hypothetical protein
LLEDRDWLEELLKIDFLATAAAGLGGSELGSDPGARERRASELRGRTAGSDKLVRRFWVLSRKEKMPLEERWIRGIEAVLLWRRWGGGADPVAAGLCCLDVDDAAGGGGGGGCSGGEWSETEDRADGGEGGRSGSEDTVAEGAGEDEADGDVGMEFGSSLLVLVLVVVTVLLLWGSSGSEWEVECERRDTAAI